jgi:hypothetical protein
LPGTMTNPELTELVAEWCRLFAAAAADAGRDSDLKDRAANQQLERICAFPATTAADLALKLAVAVAVS